MAELLSAVVERIAAKLKATGSTLAVSESASGGLISASLLAIPGASSFYLGGAVVYTQASREALLGIDAAQMTGIRSASEPYASLCAQRIRQRLGADWAIAETGAAGPTGNRYGDAAGHACIAVDGQVQAVRTIETGDSSREANMWRFAVEALTLLDEQLS
ncbi:MAG: CinA family protein [Gammaproteobacteria bacterium]|nr:CinA family protein [Gammaproteobacteria bacterium]